MRDRKRIPILNNLIESLWNKYPDMRYFQLMENIKVEHNLRTKQSMAADVFYVEDDLLEVTLYKILETGFNNGIIPRT